MNNRYYGGVDFGTGESKGVLVLFKKRLLNLLPIKIGKFVNCNKRRMKQELLLDTIDFLKGDIVDFGERGLLYIVVSVPNSRWRRFLRWIGWNNNHNHYVKMLQK